MAGVDHQSFVIGIVDQDFQQLFPSPSIPPPDKTAVRVAPPAQIGRQAAASILAAPNALPQAASPQQFTLSINYNVAQSLGIRIGEEAGIRQQLLGDGEGK